MKGFGSDYKDEKEDAPKPGTIAYLRQVEKEKQKRVQEDLEGDKSHTEKPSRSTATRPKTSQPSRAKTPSPPEDLHEVDVVSGFIKFHRSIFSVLPDLKEGELRVYLYLLSRSYGNDPPKDYCEYNQRDVMWATGINSATTVVKSMSSLVEKSLATWHPKATRRGTTSRVRVHLPCEIGKETTAKDIVRKKITDPKPL